MKYIETKKNEEKNDNGYVIHLDGFDQLIEARNNGEYAVWEYGGYVTTTDDIPENYNKLEHSEVIRQMKVKAFENPTFLIISIVSSISFLPSPGNPTIISVVTAMPGISFLIFPISSRYLSFVYFLFILLSISLFPA